MFYCDSCMFDSSATTMATAPLTTMSIVKINNVFQKNSFLLKHDYN